MGVPEGPMFSRLHRGETVVVNGREIKSEDVVGQPRPGRTIVYTGDTVPSQAFLPILKDADVWISECTFADDMADKAEETQHSTAGGVAQLAAQAGVKLLLLTHISSRYSQTRRYCWRMLENISRTLSSPTISWKSRSL